MKLVLLLVLVTVAFAFTTKDSKETDDPTLPRAQTETRSRFAALDDVRLLANGLLQLGHSLRDFVQKTKRQINDIFHKLHIFDSSVNQLSVLASEIKEEEEELKKTTVVLKANNEEIKTLSLEINSKVEDIMRERGQLRSKVGSLEEKLSGLSQGLPSANQLAEISTLKDVIHSQERSITDLLKAVKEQSEQLNYQRNKINGLEEKLSFNSFQETADKHDWNIRTHGLSGYLSNHSANGSFLSSDLPAHCGEVFSRGERDSGLYAIKPNQSEPFLVYCDITEDRVSTIIQRRRDGSVDFNQTWESYENGFGHFQGEFWQGLKKIYSIAKHGDAILHIQIEDWKEGKHFMEYQFTLDGPASNYTIRLTDVSDDHSDTMHNHVGMRFSTKDHNNGNSEDSNCAHDYTGGWWFSACGDINLNGRFIPGRPRGRTERRKGIYWRPARGSSLRSSQISIRHHI